jgi:membrane protein DedA with SNARE-associated domain
MLKFLFKRRDTNSFTILAAPAVACLYGLGTLNLWQYILTSFVGLVISAAGEYYISKEQTDG